MSVHTIPLVTPFIRGPRFPYRKSKSIEFLLEKKKCVNGLQIFFGTKSSLKLSRKFELQRLLDI